MNCIGIVGTGAMGRGIAQIAAQACLRVKLFDADPQAMEAARAALADTLARLAAKGKLTADEADAEGNEGISAFLQKRAPQYR